MDTSLKIRKLLNLTPRRKRKFEYHGDRISSLKSPHFRVLSGENLVGGWASRGKEKRVN